MQKNKLEFSKAPISVAIVLLTALAIFSYLQTRAPQNPEREYAEINFVFDGDTFKIKEETGEFKTIRLIGVDTPEVQSQYRNEECFGPEASKFAREAFLGAQVELLKDPLTDNLDKFERYLRNLKLEDGRLISEILLENGYATVYEPANFAKKEEFRKLEERAREADLGLWGACTHLE